MSDAQCTQHRFERLIENGSPSVTENGEWVVVCRVCGLLKSAPAPHSVTESKSLKPLLQEVIPTPNNLMG